MAHGFHSLPCRGLTVNVSCMTMCDIILLVVVFVVVVGDICLNHWDGFQLNGKNKRNAL